MKRRKLLKHLNDMGCDFVREGGRHSIWRHAGNQTSTAIPRHVEIDEILTRKICRQLGVGLPGEMTIDTADGDETEEDSNN